MARLNYLAPGVYVEEIPSAQQPIAGVGTSTAAFLGIVPDEIEYPVPNEDYDPQLAQAALGGGEAEAAASRKLEDEIRALEGRKGEVQKAIAELDKELAAENLPANRRREGESKKRAHGQELEHIEGEIRDKRQQLQELQAKPAANEKYIKPYHLEKFPVKADPYQTKLCTNFSEYTQFFGPFSAYDPAHPDQPKYPGHGALTHAVYGFFKNGGTKAFVVRVKTDNAAEIDKALAACESIDAIAIISAPGLSGKVIWNKLVTHCNKMEDRFAILDPPTNVETNGELDVSLLDYKNKDYVIPDRSKNAAMYFPRIQVIDPAKQMQDQDPAHGIPAAKCGLLHVSPSGHVAGIYARIDAERGVHKAPANAVVLGAVNVEHYIGRPRQELLNPQGVNCIRNMNGNITVWGARTIGGDKNGEWKYINVRRLLLFLRESIDEGTQWVVFEPNDQALWGKIRRNVGAFLSNVWRSGALFGTTSQEAFYVKCDEETNPLQVRELGQVVTEIGVAIVHPAEFVVFRISQWAGPQSSA
jgi:phage tail sheath protein FI